jgi:hypothetical protein
MPAELITTDDLRDFKTDLLDDIKQILSSPLNPSNKKTWLKSPDVRKLLGISAGTLANLRINGTLKFSKVGGIILYDYDHIVEVIQDCQVDNSN